MSTSVPPFGAPSKAQLIASWILQVLLALAFLAAASAKLAGVPMMVQVFDQIGLGQWFRIVTALVEIVGAVGLLIPGSIALGALLLATTMFVALLTHLLVLHTNPAGAVILLVLSAVVFWLRRHQLASLRGRLS